MNPFTILHVPHSSGEIPADVLVDYLLSPEELERELLFMTDHYTNELFEVPGLRMIRFPVSRLVVDPERFMDDAREEMAARGMGAFYTLTADQAPLRNPDDDNRVRLLRRYYSPHHEELNRACATCLQKSGKCLVIDCHSFPSAPLPYETDQCRHRPDVCIGTDDFHTPEWLAELTRRLFQQCGLTVYTNRPFSGALVPGDYYLQERKVLSILIEINRGLYIEESSAARLGRFSYVKTTIQNIIETIVREMDKR